MSVDLSQSIHIDCAPADVFAYLDDPLNQPEFTPSLKKICNVERLENGGTRSDFTYAMAGVTLEGSVRAAEYEPGKRIVFDMDGPLRGRITWTLRGENGGTRFIYGASYEMPNRVIEAVAGPVVERYNQRELEMTLENLRARLETGSISGLDAPGDSNVLI